MTKTRDFFRKFIDIKGTFYAWMGIKKNRNTKDLTEEEEIKKMWKEYTEELYKEVLNDSDQKDSVTWISTKMRSQ